MISYDVAAWVTDLKHFSMKGEAIRRSQQTLGPSGFMGSPIRVNPVSPF
jgi:hypothetical protein